MASKKRVLIVGAAAIALALSACGGVASSSNGESIEIRGTNLLPPGNSAADLFEWFLDELSERTDGDVDTEIVYGGALVSGSETIRALSDGRAEAGNVVPAYYPAELPLHNINMVPLPGANQSARFRAFQHLGSEVDAFVEELEANNLVLIGWFPNGSQTLATSHPVSSVEDLQGLKVRVPAAPAAAVFEELGAEPVFLASEEVYESVERGIVDGVTYPFDVQISNGVSEVAQYMITDVGQSGGSFLALSQNVYDELSEDGQAEVDDLREAWTEKAEEFLVQYEQEACSSFHEEGGEVNTWSDADQSTIGEVAARVGPEVWKDEVESTTGMDRADVDELWDNYVQLVEDYANETDYQDGLEVCGQQ